MLPRSGQSEAAGREPGNRERPRLTFHLLCEKSERPTNHSRLSNTRREVSGDGAEGRKKRPFAKQQQRWPPLTYERSVDSAIEIIGRSGRGVYAGRRTNGPAP